MKVELICQGFFFLFALASGFEEEAFTYPFREFTFDPQTKFHKLKKAHRAGAVGVLSMLILAGLVEWMTSTIPDPRLKVLSGCMCSIVCGLWYWLTFDPVFAVQIGQGPFYLGNTAGSDGWLNKL